jgi:carboxypeptidase family protein
MGRATPTNISLNFTSSKRVHAKKSARLLRAFFSIAFTLPVYIPSIHAQVSASLSGVVSDPSGAPVPGAAVTAKNLETFAVRTTQTDAAGRYRIPALSVGEYEVKVGKSGFQEETRSGMHLVVGQEAFVDLTLRVGQLQQHITVTEDAPILSTMTTDISGLIGEQQVKELPLNGRSFDLLLTLNPGVVNFTWEKTGGVGISNSTVGNMFSVSGNRPQQNIFLLNGVEFTGAAENNMQPGGTSQQLLGVDAVREFNVLRDIYGAEYGKHPGAQVSIVTQSGTHDWHGSLFEFLRNSAFDARNFFDHARIPHFERNQFGGSLGGPVQKDKTFFFVNYEGFREHLNLTDVTLVPDSNARNGILPCSLVKPATNPCPASGLANVGVAPSVAALFSLWPTQSPNAPDFGGIAEAFSTPLQMIREDFGTVRADRIFSSKDTFSAIYTVDDSDDATPTSNPFSTDIESLREQVLSLEETHVFSPAFINTVRIGFSRASYFYTGEPTPNTPAVGISGFLAGRPVGAVVIGGSAASNPAAQLSLAGSNNGSNLTITRNLFTYEDKLSITSGRHQLSLGGWSQAMQSNSGLALSQFGQATFTGLQALLQGSIGTFLFDPTPTPLGWRSWFGALYAEDVVRFNPKFTLSVGFRQETSNGWTEVDSRAANFIFGPNGAFLTQPRIGKNVFTRNNAKFLPQPRVGLAWSPFGRSKTVVRAGFGMYNDLQDALSYRLDQNAPFNPTFSIANLAVSQLPIVPGSPFPGKAKIVPGGVQPDLKTPTLISYSLKVQQEITPNFAFTIAYVGSHGYHELVSLDANEPVPTCPAPPCTAATATYPLGPGGAKPPLANPALANTFSWFSEGDSSYNALTVDMNRRFSRGFSLRGVYTFSRTLDDGDSLNATAAANAPGLVMFPADIRADWGLATFHVKNIGVINGVYELPFGNGKQFLNSLSGFRNSLVSGWRLNTIATLQSGFPFTPQLSFNPSNNGDTRNPVRPSVNPAFTGPVILGSPNGYFNPTAFIAPASGRYGNLGRDTFIGPALSSWDFSLLKDTRIREKLGLQFRAEFFNLLNHANFNTPNLITITPSGISPTAGVITSTSTTSRQIQFGLKLLW